MPWICAVFNRPALRSFHSVVGPRPVILQASRIVTVIGSRLFSALSERISSLARVGDGSQGHRLVCDGSLLITQTRPDMWVKSAPFNTLKLQDYFLACRCS